MDEDEFAAFCRRWLEADAQWRGTLLRHLTDLTEDNFVVEFTPIFASSFTDEDPIVRIAALDGMWDTTNLRYIPPIMTLMQSDPDNRVRTAAVQALSHYILMAEWGQLPKKILPSIVDALFAEYDKVETVVDVKRALLEALGSANHPRVTSLIRAAYESDSHPLRFSAVFAMGRSTDRQWVPVLLAEMESENPEMRAEAARAIGDVGSSDALSGLAELVYDEERDVQLAAIAALGMIGGEMAKEILEELAAEAADDDLLLEAIEDAREEMETLAGNIDYFDWVEDDEGEDPTFLPN
jgi:HEAT repeat protein